ncbi:MAG: NfeD family protein [Leptospiraceae bacterium]|nr:NfeD family protein [Leptospiraceae bacterium]MCK6380589.1 NfeD family protein [Leptospiraceae bacterium]NUM43027.1 NfeD family protein [Leptospiraceae bacterium]
MSDFLLSNNSAMIWILAGIILAISEFFVPGIFIIFFGIGAIFAGIISLFIDLSFVIQIFVWLISSLLTILIGGKFLKNLFPSTETFEPPSDIDFYGKEAKVIRKILPDKKGGRIRFEGTEWDAICMNEVIQKGSKVKILSRNNLTFIVEKFH